MGLDMYLKGKRYLSTWNEDSEEAKISRDIAERFPEIAGRTVNEVTCELGYWRKANAIHGWFVRHIQDGRDECQESYVSADKLRSLRDACQTVLADHTKADVLLPPTQGFFFGSSDVDQYYIEDLEATVKIIDGIVNSDMLEKGWDVYYQASW